MSNLTIDPYMNPNLGRMKDGHGSPSDATSCISSIGASGSVKEGEIDYEPMATPYSPNNYCGYYYPGYWGYSGVADDQGYYVSGDGLEMQYPAMVADDGSLVCFAPGYQPGYNPYTSYFPMAAISVDGQYAIQQPSIASPGYFPSNICYGSELLPSAYVWNPSYHVGDGVYASGYTKVSDTPSLKPILSASTHTLAQSEPTYEYRNTLENKGASRVLDTSTGYSAHNHLKGLNKPLQHGSTFKSDSIQTKGTLPFTKSSSFHQSKGGFFPNYSVNIKANGQSCDGYENVKPRSNKSNGFNDIAILNEHNNGPRTGNSKNASISTDDTVTSLDADGLKSLVRREHYNLPDFETNYSHAFFFVIKSYSEDDIHKSIKYNVWASTPNGNKRLDCAYQEAQKKMEVKGSKCPVLLFFSVNASGQFCGVAEMLGRVDFNKSMDFWQQDKWNGYFSVKWHMIKDVPNPQIRHIILENNENKPVTNSRDTQEVKFHQGIEILNIFKNYASKTSILDDFEFYESRQKVMLEKRIKPSTFRFNAVQQKTNEINRGFQMTDVSSNLTNNFDETQVGDKASK